MIPEEFVERLIEIPGGETIEILEPGYEWDIEDYNPDTKRFEKYHHYAKAIEARNDAIRGGAA